LKIKKLLETAIANSILDRLQIECTNRRSNMFSSSLIPWGWGKRNLPVRREDNQPFLSLRLTDDLDRMFDNYFNTFVSWPELGDNRTASTFRPKVDLNESEQALTVSAELPGLSESDIDVSLTKDGLLVKGEKKEETEEKKEGYHRLERRYGSFQRLIPIPFEIDQDKVEATFKNGVLRVTLPKTEAAIEEAKKIEIKKDCCS
jgi:HSP20 family protein